MDKKLVFRKYLLLVAVILSVSLAAYPQGGTRISGIVTDANQNPLIGVSLKEMGTTRGAVTNMDGAFEFMVAHLKISKVLYNKPDKHNMMNYAISLKCHVFLCMLVLMSQPALGQANSRNDMRQQTSLSDGNATQSVDFKQVANAIEIVVHRGANHLAPENIYASINAALAYDVKWVEIDVRPSKDGVLYDFHDMVLSRTTDGTGFFHQ